MGALANRAGANKGAGLPGKGLAGASVQGLKTDKTREQCNKSPIEMFERLRGMFSSGEEEDAGGLSPVKDDGEAWR